MIERAPGCSSAIASRGISERAVCLVLGHANPGNSHAARKRLSTDAQRGGVECGFLRIRCAAARVTWVFPRGTQSYLERNRHAAPVDCCMQRFEHDREHSINRVGHRHRVHARGDRARLRAVACELSSGRDERSRVEVLGRRRAPAEPRARHGHRLGAVIECCDGVALYRRDGHGRTARPELYDLTDGEHGGAGSVFHCEQQCHAPRALARLRSARRSPATLRRLALLSALTKSARQHRCDNCGARPSRPDKRGVQTLYPRVQPVKELVGNVHVERRGSRGLRCGCALWSRRGLRFRHAVNLRRHYTGCECVLIGC